MKNVFIPAKQKPTPPPKKTLKNTDEVEPLRAIMIAIYTNRKLETRERKGRAAEKGERK